MGKNKKKRHATHIPNVTIILDSFTLSRNHGAINKIRKDCEKSVFYHKFLVRKTLSYDKEYIIKSIVDFVHPAPLIPVNFKQYKKTCRFVAKDCLEAMIKILDAKCNIPHPRDPSTPFSLTVMANCHPPGDIEVTGTGEGKSKNTENDMEDNDDDDNVNSISGGSGNNYSENV
ncbi:unnamed protein product [Psylliodes chrysocephalus]|uniref:Uncharacterized protein n=1 Tax=Psylliodes chrysocephalus TaxID=3402493 RepID=A0A9P0G749_9CUCU|nr:unnamed protein product [Psylliodes chrysocephala]